MKTMKKLITLAISAIFVMSFSACHNFNIKSKKQIRTHLEPNVVHIGYEGLGHGSGFIINYNGNRFIVTNSHVCQIAVNNILEVKSNLNEDKYLVHVIKRDRLHDICITTVPKHLHGNGLYLGMMPNEGDNVFVLGFPLGNRKTFVFGEYTGEVIIKINYSYNEKECPVKRKTVRGFFGDVVVCQMEMAAGEITSPIYPGNSGSAVVNNRGLVVGVIFAGNPMSNVSNYMIGVRFLKNLLKSL